MSIELSLFLAKLFVTNPSEVVLLICIEVESCLWHISSRVCCAWMASWQLMKRAPISASASYEMTALIIWEMFRTAPFFGGVAVSLDMKKLPPDLLQALDSDRYYALLRLASAMSLA